MVNRWFDLDPFREMTTLRDAMSQLFDQAFVRPSSALTSGFVVPMNVYELDRGYVVQAYLPGLGPDDIEVTTQQNTLTIKGRFPEPVTGEEKQRVTWLLQEFGGGQFSRSIVLPKSIDSNHIEANFDRGVLTLHLPVAEHELPKKIAITAGEGKQTVEALPGQNHKEPALTGAGGR